MSLQQHIEKLNALDLRMSSLTYMEALFGWDSMTLASKKGLEQRGAVIGNLSELRFTTLINDEIEATLNFLMDNKEMLDETTYAKVKLYQREYNATAKIPKDEYAAYRSLITKSNNAWEEAREKDDFSIFAPYLEQVITTLKKFIGYRGFEGHPYNTLLDDYEPGLTVDECDKFFTNLRAKIVPLVKKISEQPDVDNSFTSLSYDVKKQADYTDYISDAICFDKEAGCIAESAHPFTMNLSRGDVRFTTHYHENDILSAVSSTIHETGHALYEQNISDAYGVSILTAGVSMGIHESQSRIYENNFGRSLPFWNKHYGKLQDMYQDQLGSIDVETFQKSMNTVKPSLIRIEADEVTYPLHIMVRYEMEKMILSEDINIYDLPGLWNDKYEEYLGIRPSSDKEGILQDVHWSEGLVGYFPSYALGSAYAAQFEFYMRKDLDVDQLLEDGDMQPILDWLAKNIHTFGSSKEPAEIIEFATGESFNPDYFTDYLNQKYSKVYGLKD